MPVPSVHTVEEKVLQDRIMRLERRIQLLTVVRNTLQAEVDFLRDEKRKEKRK